MESQVDFYGKQVVHIVVGYLDERNNRIFKGTERKPSMSDLLGGLMRLWALVTSLFRNFLGLILLDCSPFL